MSAPILLAFCIGLIICYGAGYFDGRRAEQKRHLRKMQWVQDQIQSIVDEAEQEDDKP